ncbi:MAG TPA: hypothetical protein DCO72_03945 [Ruminococcus sp.]|nr:hypothetical protein [Ruminococcus sp.]
MYSSAFLKREKQTRVNLRYQYYEMKNYVPEISNMLPASFRNVAHSFGWCAKAVDSLADRIAFLEFSNDGGNLNEIFRLNNQDILIDSAVSSALISACSFIFIELDENGFPRLQVIDGANATGEIDPVTMLLDEGYAVIERDAQTGKPILEAYFLPNVTYYFRNGILDESLTLHHKAPFPLLVPIVNRPDAKRPFGHSRISRSCMDCVQTVIRTLRRSEVSSEFYSVPQKYILGLSGEAEEKFDKEKATISSLLYFGKDEEGDKPTMGQFQIQSMTPFVDQMKMLASVFAGETGLTLDDLGFSTDNPASSEAIKASHENLRLTARKAQQTFATGFLNAGYLAACLRDNYSYARSAFAGTQAEWMPIFEPDASALGGIGDAILKINQASEGFLGARNIRALTGLESDAD